MNMQHPRIHGMVLALIFLAASARAQEVTATRVRTGNGSVTQPSFTFNFDSGLNTGFFRPGENMIGGTIGGQLVWKLRPTNRTNSPDLDRPGFVHMFVDENKVKLFNNGVATPLVDDTWLNNHTYQGVGLYGDNHAFADLWYDGVHRRLVARSLLLHEVADPADLRLGRAPGHGGDNGAPNEIDGDNLLPVGTIVGHVGFDVWRNQQNGFGAYMSAMQGRVSADPLSGFLDLSTTTSHTYTDSLGQLHETEELVRRLSVGPNGQVNIGEAIDPSNIPNPLLDVNGAVRGTSVCIGGDCRSSWPSGGGGGGTLSCTNRVAEVFGTQVSVQCQAGEIATGGGGGCDSGALRNTRPAGASGWEITCQNTGLNRADVMCCRIQ